MSVRDELYAAPPYHFTARSQSIKLDQNESPYDLPNALKRQVFERLAQIPFNRYPEINAHTLRGLLAARYDWAETGVVVSGGSNVLIQGLVSAAGMGKTVLTVAPTFSVYPMQAKLLGARLLECELEKDFSLPLEALKAELRKNSGIFFLANPAAPTGNTFSAEATSELAEASADRWIFVIDEAYHQFSNTNFAGLVKAHPHVVSLRTLSKAFGLGGVRLGYGLMQPELAEQVQKVLMPFSISALQLAVGEVVLNNPAYAETYIAEVEVEREKLSATLNSLPDVTPYPSETNFILFKVSDVEAFFEGLLRRDIVIRRQDYVPGLSGCLRVSVGTPAQNEAFMKAATEVAQQLTQQSLSKQEVEHV